MLQGFPQGLCEAKRMMEKSEDFCSYEQSKILKKKGFNYPCFSYFREKGNGDEEIMATPPRDFNEDADKISRPTHQMTLKWLRLEKKIFIDVCYKRHVSQYGYSDGFCWGISSVSFSEKLSNKLCYTGYDFALIEAVNYALHNHLATVQHKQERLFTHEGGQQHPIRRVRRLQTERGIHRLDLRHLQRVRQMPKEERKRVVQPILFFGEHRPNVANDSVRYGKDELHRCRLQRYGRKARQSLTAKAQTN